MVHTVTFAIRILLTVAAPVIALAVSPAPGHAQQVYLGAGLGYSFALNGLDGARNMTVSFGLETRGPLGFRFEGNETISLLFLTANVSYTFGSREDQIRPYIIGGVGRTFALFDPGEFTLNLGLGLLFSLSSRLRVFAEGRVFHLLNTDETRPTILPVTVGLQVLF